MAIRATTSVTLPQSQNVCFSVDASAAGWAFGSPQDGHFFFAADVVVDHTPPMPPTLATRRSPWQVGFIQNVLSDRTTLTFDNAAPVTTAVSQACLDAQASSSAPWICGRVDDVLHYGTVQGVNSFWYQGPGKPVRFRISMADWPRFAVFNFLGGGRYPGNGGGQVRSVESTRHFRTWVAAREEINPANVASSFVLLQMVEFAIRVRITLGPAGANPLFGREIRAAHAGTSQPPPQMAPLDVAVDHGTVVGGQFRPGSMRWGAPPRGVVPVVTPPLANVYYPAQLAAQNAQVAPQSLSVLSATRCI